MLNSGQNWPFFVPPCDLEIWCMTLKNNRAPLLYYVKFVHHFKSIDEVKLELQSGNAQFGSKLAIFLSRVTLKFDGWPSKTIGHLFCTTWSFVQHFKAIGIFKLELQSGNEKFGSKSTIFLAMWPWNLTDDLEQGKSEGFDSCDRPSNLTKIGLNSSIFQPVWPWNLMDDQKKQ